MKDQILQWVEDHKYEHEDGTWQQMDDGGEPYGPVYKTETELDDAMWMAAVDDPLGTYITVFGDNVDS